MGNILITSAGRRVSLVRIFKEELKKLLPQSKVYVVDSNPNLSAAAQVADGAFKICKISDEDYIASLLKVCKQNNIKLIIPTIDNELLKLSLNSDEFKANQINVIVSNEEFVRQSESKIASNHLFEKLGVATPELYSKSDYRFPIFIKPEKGSSSSNTHVVWNASQLSGDNLTNNDLLFFEYLNPIDYDEFTCDVYFGRDGKVKCAIPRKRLEVRAGEVSKSVTQKNVLLKLFEENSEAFLGARGCVNVQFFVHKESQQVKGIEFNARFGGGFPLSYLAGGNFSKWIIEEYLLGKTIKYFNEWEENLLMLRYDHEILVHNYEE